MVAKDDAMRLEVNANFTPGQFNSKNVELIRNTRHIERGQLVQLVMLVSCMHLQ